MDYASISEIGSREVNEDSHFALENNGRYLFAVADGLGGHGRGEVAARIVTETIKDFFMDSSTFDDGFLANAITQAQDNVIKEQKATREVADAKSTVAALLIANGVCRIAHVGDTRVYVFHKSKVKMRTLDHSVSQMLAISGEIKDRHIRDHPDRNRLLRAIGIDWDSPQYELSGSFPVSEYQAFLLCSDGFWELCNEKQMCTYLKKSNNAADWLSAMTMEVKNNGNSHDMDNFTAIAVKS